MTQLTTLQNLSREFDIKRTKGGYDVVLFNDDKTDRDFVISLLIAVFRMSRIDAQSLVSHVERVGKGVAGSYSSLDVAQTKRDKAISMARSENYPLQITVEKADES